jgi:hypothetical protein
VRLAPPRSGRGGKAAPRAGPPVGCAERFTLVIVSARGGAPSPNHRPWRCAWAASSSRVVLLTESRSHPGAPTAAALTASIDQRSSRSPNSITRTGSRPVWSTPMIRTACPLSVLTVTASGTPRDHSTARPLAVIVPPNELHRWQGSAAPRGLGGVPPDVRMGAVVAGLKLAASAVAADLPAVGCAERQRQLPAMCPTGHVLAASNDDGERSVTPFVPDW